VATPRRAGSRRGHKGPFASMRPPWRRFNKSRSPAPSVSSEGSEVSEASLDTQCSSEYAAAPMFWEDEEMYMRWCNALNGRSTSELAAEELHLLVKGGMPLKHRLALWPQWFIADTVEDIDALQQGASGDVERLIDLDVPRTLPQWLNSAEQGALRRILLAHASLNPGLGYCQGLNNMAAVFVVLGFDEATALRGLCSLVQGVCKGYHSSDLSGFRRDALVLGALARQLLPEGTGRALDLLGVPLEVLASEHFLSLASRAWPLAATLQLWDLILLEGIPALFASFLALLELYLPSEDEQLALGDATPVGGDDADPVVFFRQAVLRGVNEDFGSIVKRINELLPQLPMSLIDHYRFTYGSTTD